MHELVELLGRRLQGLRGSERALRTPKQQQLLIRRELVGGRLPKDGYLLGDLEMRTIIETYAEDEAIFLAVRAALGLV